MYQSLKAYYEQDKSLRVLYKHHHNQDNSYYFSRASNSRRVLATLCHKYSPPLYVLSWPGKTDLGKAKELFKVTDNNGRTEIQIQVHLILEHVLNHHATPYPTLGHHGLPHWALSKSIGSEAQDVKIRCDKHADRSHPKADIITEQLDLCSRGLTSGVTGCRLETSPRVLWMNFNGQENTSSKLVLPDAFFFEH